MWNPTGGPLVGWGSYIEPAPPGEDRIPSANFDHGGTCFVEFSYVGETYIKLGTPHISPFFFF